MSAILARHRSRTPVDSDVGARTEEGRDLRLEVRRLLARPSLAAAPRRAGDADLDGDSNHSDLATRCESSASPSSTPQWTRSPLGGREPAVGGCCREMSVSSCLLVTVRQRPFAQTEAHGRKLTDLPEVSTDAVAAEDPPSALEHRFTRIVRASRFRPRCLTRLSGW